MKIVCLIALNVLREIFRKKDLYVLIVMLFALLIYLAKAAFFGMSHIYRYLNELGLAMVFLFSILIAVPHSARLMIEEVRSKTIYPLLAKPVKRVHVLIGKFLGSLLISWSSFTAFFLVFSLISICKQGNGGVLTAYLQVFIGGLLMLAVLNAMAIFFSVYFTFSTAVTLSYTVFFIMSWFGSSLEKILSRFYLPGEIIYYILPHFEFFDLRHRLIHNWELLPLWVMSAISLYAFLYISGLLFLAFQGFKRRWL